MKRRGFTYIELMTVWAIISILAAILFPVFSRAKAKAWQNQCLENLYNLGIGLRVYAQDNYGHFPAVNNDFTPLLARALPDARVLVCPSAPYQGRQVPAGTLPPEPPPGWTNYVYWGGACDDDRPTCVIAGDEDEGLHNQGCNYLYVDGHCKWGAWTNCVPAGAGPYTELTEYGFAQLQQCREMKPGYKPSASRVGQGKGGSE
jgi:prepilin-type N-terminal cleavage/methylation domain-containing protein/prepilin-type processing-associated H-X9-DG protein